ncbi:hypothetical protein DINM_000138 [Dirofilaria immitis]|nr:hypothetical protein [Dirofilaria immitis]
MFPGYVRHKEHVSIAVVIASHIINAVLNMIASLMRSASFIEFVAVQTRKYESEKLGMCPDGSSWLRQCSDDSDCFTNEICAVGRCCSVCSQHRRRVLNDLPTNNVVGVHIPQCDPIGKYYRAVQCRIGTEECWCVSQFGRIIGSLKPKTPNLNAACEALRLIVKRIVKEERKIYPTCKNSIIDGIRDKCLWMKRGQCPDRPVSIMNASKLCYCDDDCSDSQKCCPVLTGGWACYSNITIDTGTVMIRSQQQRKQYAPKMNNLWSVLMSANQRAFQEYRFHASLNDARVDVSANQNQCPQQITHCIDSLREYKTCGPACPISCSSKSEKCGIERCVEGCFCKVPYVLENGADPLHSKCILPIYCPPLTADNSPVNTTVHFTAVAPVNSKSHFFPERREDSINQLIATQCIDPFKNFQICGSSCPDPHLILAGCNNQVTGFCGTQCVAGCFCRNPYILEDSYNLNSRCVLPHQCQSLTVQQQICSDPRKNGQIAFHTKTACTTDDCTPGCICREPYLLYDSSNPNSRCVLPSECGSQCSDSLKEYQACASSCPMGCNNRIPQTCSPCVSGCFCKSGFVFENAINWRTSKCIPLNQCPMTNISAVSVAFIPENDKSDVLASMTECPATTVDLSGKFCNFDSDCPAQQRCCRSTSFSMVSSKQSRCTCIDPHAYWDSCGILCPEYCGQLTTPVCSSTCNPGCHCAAGYVKARNHVMAPCVLRTQCSQLEDTIKSHYLWKEIATAKMLSDGNKIIGDVKIKEISKEKLNWKVQSKKCSMTKVCINSGLPIGEHALIVHQAGDLSDSCANIGPIMAPDKKFNVSAIFGNVKTDGNKNTTIDREIDWPQDVSLIGRSLVIHKLSVMEWSLRNVDVLPLACGTIGFASS